jgi:hypothetical protein
MRLHCKLPSSMTYFITVPKYTYSYCDSICQVTRLLNMQCKPLSSSSLQLLAVLVELRVMFKAQSAGLSLELWPLEKTSESHFQQGVYKHQ